MNTSKNSIRFSLITIAIFGCLFNVSAESNKRIYNDAAAFLLKGHVKSCTDGDDSPNEYNTIYFNPDGSYKTDEYTITRDYDNMLIKLYNEKTKIEITEEGDSIEHFESSCREFLWSSMPFPYGEKWTMHSEGINYPGDRYFLFDQYGNIESEIYHYIVTAFTYTRYDYKYLEFDSHGNWTKRQQINSYFDYRGSVSISIEDPRIETRTITYYE